MQASPSLRVNLSHQLMRSRLLILGFALAITLVLLATVSAIKAAAPATVSPSAYRQQLLSQVDTPAGAPQVGHNPAAQGQTSLASVASMPDDIGKRTDNPAASVVGIIRHTDPATVLPDTKTTGVLASGCLLGYGAPGAQCLPSSLLSSSPATSCSGINKLFPTGIAITGSDSQHLNTGASTACGTATAAPTTPDTSAQPDTHDHH